MKFVMTGPVVDAVRYTGYTGELPYEMGVTILRSTERGACFMPVDGVETECKVGDWIIREPLADHGHKLYPMTNDDFLKRFHPAPGQSQQ